MTNESAAYPNFFFREKNFQTAGEEIVNWSSIKFLQKTSGFDFDNFAKYGIRRARFTELILRDYNNRFKNIELCCFQGYGIFFILQIS